MASDALKELLLFIPYPSYIPRARGIHSTLYYGTVLKCKCAKKEMDTVEAAAVKLNITKSEFIRWVTVKAAEAVLGENHVSKSDQQSQIGGQDYDPSKVDWDTP